MKHRTLYLLALATILFLAPQLRAQNMVIRMQGGTEQSVLLNNLQKITFSGNNLVLNYVTGGTQSYGFSSLEKLFFSQGTYVNNNTFPNPDIYFNASENKLYFKNLPDLNNRVAVYRLDGVSVVRTTVSDGGTIDMSNVPAGIYIIRANNKVVKIKK